jgi:hypothetical protein
MRDTGNRKPETKRDKADKEKQKNETPSVCVRTGFAV